MPTGRTALSFLQTAFPVHRCVYATGVIDAATLVREARESASMSARALAAESGVSPSTVTRIERGEISPTVSMLERLLRASGHELEIGLSRSDAAPTISEVRSHADTILEIVQRIGGRDVRLIGSVARGDATPTSDLDLLIDVPPGTGLFALETMRADLDAALPWSVDVLTSGAARGRMAHVLDDAVAL
ncbi:MAG: helix-turn-helix domain-containing protein [Actinomycetota bacterium]